MIKKGKIVVIEGVDGAGKTTQINLLKEFLNKKENIEKFGESLFFREPGSTDAGGDIREVILNYDLDPKTEALLFYASRNELILNEILPAINSGKNVIIDRFELSTFAYQIYGRERSDLKDFIYSLSKNIVPENFVDKYYFFDLDVEISKKREASRNEESSRFDIQGVNFFNKIRNGYKAEIKNFNHLIIDASKSIDEIFESLSSDIIKVLEK